jgi:hypothetical protein
MAETQVLLLPVLSVTVSVTFCEPGNGPGLIQLLPVGFIIEAVFVPA